MSKIYYIDLDACFIDFENVREQIQSRIKEEFVVKCEPYDKENGLGALFYIEEKSACGVHVFKKDKKLAIKLDGLCNYPDYIIAKYILIDFSNFCDLEESLTDENGEKVNLEGLFSDEKILEECSSVQNLNFDDYEIDTDSDDEDEDDSLDYQCHGSHWRCVSSDFQKEMGTFIQNAVENGKVAGQNETDFCLEEDNTKVHGKVFELEYSLDEKDDLSVRVIIAAQEGSNQFVSFYPVVRNGVKVSVKINDIKEWQNGLEAWIEGSFPDGRDITFFDADYALNKEKYEIGKTYNFIIGALSYYAEEPETKGIKLEGQDAINFKAKFDEDVEYDEQGNIKPVEISTANLCAFFQTRKAIDDAEYISKVDKVEKISNFKRAFWKFDVVYRAESNETLIPTFALKTDENKNLNKATQIQGVAWLTGYLA